MTSSIFLNNHTVNDYAMTETCKSITNAAGVEQKVLSREEIEALVDVLPEMRQLEEVLDSFYYKLHDDRKLSQFSNFFSQILTNNPKAFKCLDSDQKKQVLFDKYRELTLNNLLTTKDYQEAYQPLQGRIGEWIKDGSHNQIVMEKLDQNFKSRINQLHSDFIAFAIANPLNVNPIDVRFLSKYQLVDLDLSSIDLSLLKG